MINEEYKIWKKNSPFLYDIVYSHCLVWPSLTVEWFNDKTIPHGSDSSHQKLLLGTHTSDDEQNYLQIMKVKVPLEDTSIKSNEFNDADKEANGFGAEKQRIEIETKINHSGEVNRARMMPGKQNIIATKTISGEIHIFDYHKHPTEPKSDEVKPQLKLTGHSKEGYGLCWN